MLAFALAALVLKIDAAEFRLPMEQPPASSAAEQPKHGEPCIVPAGLTPDPAIHFEETKEGAPADLPGPRYEPPQSLTLPLELFLPPPAPFGTKLDLGTAAIDTESGAVTINGESHAPAPIDCP